METNLEPNRILHVYATGATEYGDATASGTPHQMKALVEDTYTWETAEYQDISNAALICEIWPDDSLYLARKGQLQGLVCQYSRFDEQPNDKNWYRIESVRPGESIVDGDPDLVELIVTRIEKNEAMGES